MTYAYRQLAVDDLVPFRELMAVFGRAFEDAESYGDAPPSDAYVRAWLAKPHVIALVATQNGAVVGGLVAYVLEKFERERAEVYIYDLAVAEVHRRKGIATELIQQLRRLAKPLGASVIFVQADYVDAPAVRLYESLGTREEVLHFDIEVDGDDFS